MKPVVVFTVYRRYYELSRALARLDELRGEFAEPPDVVVVWARPEVGRLWYFQRLLREGKVNHLLTRLPLPGERDDGPTTYPESHNIRLGLEFAARQYGPGAYAVLQAADVLPNPANGYGFIDGHMGGGAGAVLFHWPNGCVPSEIWHTNFFAVRLDPAYWPPVLGPDATDVLEWAWGKALMNARPPRVEKNHNYNGKRFTHAHLSEGEPAWPVVPQGGSSSVGLVVSGRKHWLRRLLDWVRGRR